MIEGDRSRRCTQNEFIYEYDIKRGGVNRRYKEVSNKEDRERIVIVIREEESEAYKEEEREYKKNDKEIIKKRYIQIRCGRCMGCKKEKEREWIIRNKIESNRSKRKYYIEIRGIKELKKKDISTFNKKLRVNLERMGNDSNFRFFVIGEWDKREGEYIYRGIYYNLDLCGYEDYIDKRNYIEESKAKGRWFFNNKILDRSYKGGKVDIVDISLSNEGIYLSGDYVINEKREEYKGGEFILSSRMPGIGYVEKEEEIESNIDGIEEDEEIYNVGENTKFHRVPYYYKRINKDV